VSSNLPLGGKHGQEKGSRLVILRLGEFGFLNVSSRFAILSLILFFVVGILLLMNVKLEKGTKEAIQASA
jgi:hypothetical protein